MNLKDLSSVIEDIATNMNEVDLIYLFGSQVGEKTGPMSDIDIGVVISHNKDALKIQAELKYQLSRRLNFDLIDVVILNRAPVELEYAVISTGRPLFQRNLETRVDYEAKVLSRYGDYLPILRSHRSDILRGDNYATRVQRYREAFRRTERTLSEIRNAYKSTAKRL